MTRWTFAKYSGCGNDFILFDNRQKDFPLSHPGLIQRLCHRQLGIGADGVLLLEPSTRADSCLRILNSDGSEAEMCGNGLRCFVKWLASNGMPQQSYCIEVMNRLYRTSLEGSAVKIEMGSPQDVQWDIALNFEGQSLNAHHLNTGVPHTIIFVDSIDQVKLAELGPHIRYHALWKPNGTNLTIAQQVAPHSFKVRTYERGVEAETLACGTGATAAALAAAYQCHLTGPLTMQTQLGEELTIDFKLNHNHFSDVTLTGPAQRIFEGEIDLVK